MGRETKYKKKNKVERPDSGVWTKKKNQRITAYAAVASRNLRLSQGERGGKKRAARNGKSEGRPKGRKKRLRTKICGGAQSTLPGEGQQNTKKRGKVGGVRERETRVYLKQGPSGSGGLSDKEKEMWPLDD